MSNAAGVTDTGHLPFAFITPNYPNRFRCLNKIHSHIAAYERLRKKITEFVRSVRFDRGHLNLKYFTEEDVLLITRNAYELYGSVGLAEEVQRLVAFDDLGQSERDMTVRSVETLLESPEALRPCLDEPSEVRQIRVDFYEVVIAQTQARYPKFSISDHAPRICGSQSVGEKNR